jgi:hypothetical protein
MNIRNLISKLIAQVCEKNYAAANKTLDTVVTEKVKTRIKKIAAKQKTEKAEKSKKITKKVTKKNK